jgi:hypothetical protein
MPGKIYSQNSECSYGRLKSEMWLPTKHKQTQTRLCNVMSLKTVVTIINLNLTLLHLLDLLLCLSWFQRTCGLYLATQRCNQKLWSLTCLGQWRISCELDDDTSSPAIWCCCDFLISCNCVYMQVLVHRGHGHALCFMWTWSRQQLHPQTQHPLLVCLNTDWLQLEVTASYPTQENWSMFLSHVELIQSAC